MHRNDVHTGKSYAHGKDFVHAGTWERLNAHREVSPGYGVYSFYMFVEVSWL